MTTCPVAHDYDPLAPSMLRDPYPVLTQLREDGPVFYLPELDHYIVTRYDDIEQVLLDRDTWSAANASSPLNPVCPAAQEVLNAGFKRVPTLNNADPPRHGPMRKAVLACMTPRRLNALEPTLRAYAEDLVQSFQDEPIGRLRRRVRVPVPRIRRVQPARLPREPTPTSSRNGAAPACCSPTGACRRTSR